MKLSQMHDSMSSAVRTLYTKNGSFVSKQNLEKSRFPIRPSNLRNDYLVKQVINFANGLRKAVNEQKAESTKNG